jgi:hypothetical protein
MPDLTVNGVPLFDPAPAAPVPPPQAAGAGAVVASLRELSEGCERVFGFGLEQRALELLAALDRLTRDGDAVTAQALAAASATEPARALALLEHLARTGLVTPQDPAPDGPTPADDASAWRPTPRFALAMRQFTELADSAFLSRHALRQSLLWMDVADPALAHRLQRLFDRFFDLGWLYLHNWGSTCQVTATLAATVLQREGLDARVCQGSLALRHGERSFRLGRSGLADASQIDVHLFCLVQGQVLLDLGLGNVRRRFLRGYPWAVAFDARPEGLRAGTIESPRWGRAEWWLDEPEPAPHAPLQAQLDAAQEVARRLMPLYPDADAR